MRTWCGPTKTLPSQVTPIRCPAGQSSCLVAASIAPSSATCLPAFNHRTGTPDRRYFTFSQISVLMLILPSV